ncbi:MAG TPA: hypothetical protein DCL75_11290, partial [Ktedonobacter sp.]|nr:hypothetical protein [Ktedonobacter sp.]HCJ35967.1 hypothetical protein [Ktedonobacter sp.]
EASELLSAFNDMLKHDGFVLREITRISGKPVYKATGLRGGVHSNVKNLIFAANGFKPEIVLIDSVSNDIQIVKNEEYCLVYDKPILERGLLWKDLLDWWCEKQQLLFLARRDLEIHL